MSIITGLPFSTIGKYAIDVIMLRPEFKNLNYSISQFVFNYGPEPQQTFNMCEIYFAKYEDETYFRLFIDDDMNLILELDYIRRVTNSR